MNRAPAFLIVLLACATSYAQVPIADSPVLLNPGFEEGGDQPANWSKAIYGDGFTLTRDPNVGHTGQASARLEATATPGSRACYLQTSRPFKPDVALRLRFWYKGTGRADGILRFRPIAGVKVEGDQYGTLTFACPLPKTDWTEYVFEAPVPQGAREQGAVRAEVILYQRAEGVVWYDDVSLESLAEWKTAIRAPESPLVCPNRPADGRKVLQNPPDFSWNPQPGANTYTLQFSERPDFPEGAVVQVGPLAYNVYSHNETFAPGTWYWRVRYEDASGTVSNWTQTRSFVVTDLALPFPVPAADDLLGRIPASHPRVYATAESLTAFREPMNGSRREWWESFQRRIDGWVDRTPDKEPAEDKLFGSGQQLTDDVVDRANRLRSFCGGVNTRMQQLAFGYLLSGERKYANAAIAQAVEVAAWDPNGVTSYGNHDQVFRDIAWTLACVYDWCHDALDEPARIAIRSAVEARASVLYNDFAKDGRRLFEYPYDSHGITAVGFLGICAIALAHESEQADEWFRFVASVYPAIYPPWGGEEGGWSQGVGYWKWSSPFAWWFFDALKSATGFDLYQKVWQRNDGWYKLTMHPPFCDRHHFGDGNHGTPDATDQSNMAHLAKVFDNGYFQWYADSLPGTPDAGIYSYWWFDDDLDAVPPADIDQGAYFPDIGWVAMHSDLSDPDDVMLLFKSSPYGSYNHSHADQNSFVVYGYGEPLLIDSGYYDWYGSPHDNGWTRQTRAHNCVLVNGQGQPIHDMTARGKITSHFNSPLVDYTCGDATEAYKGLLTSFKRHILFLRPDTFLILDELEAPEPSEFTWSLHAENEMELAPESNEVTITRGGAKCLVKFLSPEALSFTQDDQFLPPPTRARPNEWHAYATTKEKSKTARFAVLIRPYRAEGDEVKVELPEAVDGTVSVQLGDIAAGGEALAVRLQPGARPSWGDFSTDGLILALAARGAGRCRGVPGEFDSTYAMVEATRVGAEAGTAVLTSDVPVTGCLEYGIPRGMSELAAADLLLPANAQVSIYTAPGVETVLLDGQPVRDFDYDRATNQLRLSIAAGRHELRINPPETAPADLDATLRLSGEQVPLSLRTMLTPLGKVLAWGSFEGAAAPFSAHVEAPAGTAVRIGSQTVKTDAAVWLSANNRLEIRAPRITDPVRIALEPLLAPGDDLGCGELPETIADAPGVVKIEAERIANFGNGLAKAYSHRAFLSGGQGLECAVIPGQWVEWDVEVPVPGTYQVALKAAVFEDNARRLLELDGKPLGAAFRAMRLPNTGGFGATPAQWRVLSLLDETGQPISVGLSAGAHRLRLSTLERRANLDYILLIPAGAGQ